MSLYAITYSCRYSGYALLTVLLLQLGLAILASAAMYGALTEWRIARAQGEFYAMDGLVEAKLREAEAKVNVALVYHSWQQGQVGYQYQRVQQDECCYYYQVTVRVTQDESKWAAQSYWAVSPTTSKRLWWRLLD